MTFDVAEDGVLNQALKVLFGVEGTLYSTIEG